MSLRVGVDIGGSFADFAVLDEETRTIRTLKVFSRPDAPGSEVIAGIEKLKERYDIDPGEIGYFTHGTTVGVNAVVQRKGLRLALLTTRNFEDVLDIARLKIPNMYHLKSRRPAPLVSRDRVYGISERIAANGSETEPVVESSVLDALEKLQAAGCEGVVVSLLHAYRNPSHEQEVKRIIQRAAPDLFVCCSHEVWPIVREYERTITAVIGGYVQPRVTHYLTSLQKALGDSGVQVDLKVTKSNGGVMSAQHGKSNCVQMILSGTASGVIGAAYVAETCGAKNCMSLDIGGTTADIALIVDGQPQFATGEYIGDFQLHIPSVSVSSVGEGGGSIAWVDDFGVLKVGPDSAGSTPGPACYGKGGTRPTITDAYAVLGIIGSLDLGYNTVRVDTDAARRAIEPLADRIGISVVETAEAIVNVAVSSMYSGASRVISKFGIDPRDFHLMPFGGAGPMMACYLAKALKTPKLLIPATPGVLSALGGLVADIKNDFVRTVFCDLDEKSVAGLSATATELEVDARRWLKSETGSDDQARIVISADMRYKGQSFEIDTPIALEWLVNRDIHSLSDAFHQEHERIYGHSDRGAKVQIIALRLVIVSATPKPKLRQIEDGTGIPLTPILEKEIWMEGRMHQVPIYQRTSLLAHQRFTGPAIIAQDDTTICVLPGFTGVVDSYGNIELANAELNTEVK